MTLATLCLSFPWLSSYLTWANLGDEDTPGGLGITGAEICDTNFRVVVIYRVSASGLKVLQAQLKHLF